MYTLCSPVALLVLLVAAAVILCAFFLVRFVQITEKPKNNFGQRDATWLIIGLLVVAFLTIGAFVIYALTGIGPC